MASPSSLMIIIIMNLVMIVTTTTATATNNTTTLSIDYNVRLNFALQSKSSSSLTNIGQCHIASSLPPNNGYRITFYYNTITLGYYWIQHYTVQWYTSPILSSKFPPLLWRSIVEVKQGDQYAYPNFTISIIGAPNYADDGGENGDNGIQGGNSGHHRCRISGQYQCSLTIVSTQKVWYSNLLTVHNHNNEPISTIPWIEQLINEDIISNNVALKFMLIEHRHVQVKSDFASPNSSNNNGKQQYYLFRCKVSNFPTYLSPILLSSPASVSASSIMTKYVIQFFINTNMVASYDVKIGKESWFSGNQPPSSSSSSSSLGINVYPIHNESSYPYYSILMERFDSLFESSSESSSSLSRNNNRSNKHQLNNSKYYCSIMFYLNSFNERYKLSIKNDYVLKYYSNVIRM